MDRKGVVPGCPLGATEDHGKGHMLTVCQLLQALGLFLPPALLLF